MKVFHETDTEKLASEHEANTTGLLPKRGSWVAGTGKNALKLSCNQINGNSSLTRISSERKDYFNPIIGMEPRDIYSHLCQHLWPLKACLLLCISVFLCGF